MHIMSPIVTSEFECVGSECPDTCCAGWGIIIDPDSVKYFNSVPGEIGDRLRKSIYEKKSTYYMGLNDEGRCPLLNEKNLCSVYLTLGADKMSYVCKVFPRHTFRMDNLVLSYLSFACLEAVRQFITYDGSMKFVISETSDTIINTPENTNLEIYNTFLHALTTGIELLQNRELSIRERMIVFISFIFCQQQNLDREMSDQTTMKVFSDRKMYPQILLDDNVPSRDVMFRIKMYRLLWESFFGVSHKRSILMKINRKFELYMEEKNIEEITDDICSSMEAIQNEEIEQELEQLLVYLCFRYILTGYEEKELVKSLGNIVVFYTTYLWILTIDTMINDMLPDRDRRILIISHLSRYYEHNVKMFSDVHELMEENHMSDIFSLMKLV